jgi:hypothetical protein
MEENENMSEKLVDLLLEKFIALSKKEEEE